MERISEIFLERNRDSASVTVVPPAVEAGSFIGGKRREGRWSSLEARERGELRSEAEAEFHVESVC